MEFEISVHELSPAGVSAQTLGPVPLKPGAGLPQAAGQTLQPHGPLLASVAGRLQGPPWEGPQHWEGAAEVRAVPRRSCPQVASLFTCLQEVFVISGVQLPLPPPLPLPPSSPASGFPPSPARLREGPQPLKLPTLLFPSHPPLTCPGQVSLPASLVMPTVLGLPMAMFPSPSFGPPSTRITST